MKPAILLLCGLFIAVTVTGQPVHSKNSQATSAAIKRVSESWKSDPFGQKCIRSKLFATLRHSKVDLVTPEYLLKMLGKPNSKGSAFAGVAGKDNVVFVYWVSCGSWNGKNYMGGYISFVFDYQETKLLYISDGDICG